MSACTRYRWKNIYIACNGTVSQYPIENGRFRAKLQRARQHPRKAADLAEAFELGSSDRLAISRKPEAPSASVEGEKYVPVDNINGSAELSLDLLCDLRPLQTLDVFLPDVSLGVLMTALSGTEFQLILPAPSLSVNPETDISLLSTATPEIKI